MERMLHCTSCRLLRHMRHWNFTNHRFSHQFQLKKTHYQVLGLRQTATKKEIKAAFVELSKKNHPDSNPNDPGSHNKFVRISEAYGVLSKHTSRREYDFTLQQPRYQTPMEAQNRRRYQTPAEAQEEYVRSYGFARQRAGGPLPPKEKTTLTYTIVYIVCIFSIYLAVVQYIASARKKQMERLLLAKNKELFLDGDNGPRSGEHDDNEATISSPRNIGHGHGRRYGHPNTWQTEYRTYNPEYVARVRKEHREELLRKKRSECAETSQSAELLQSDDDSLISETRLLDSTDYHYDSSSMETRM